MTFGPDGIRIQSEVQLLDWTQAASGIARRATYRAFPCIEQIVRK